MESVMPLLIIMSDMSQIHYVAFFYHLSSTVLNFITAAGRPQASVAALYAGSGFSLAFLTFLLLFLKQMLQQACEHN